MLEKEVYPGFLKNDTKNLIKQMRAIVKLGCEAKKRRRVYP